MVGINVKSQHKDTTHIPTSIGILVQTVKKQLLTPIIKLVYFSVLANVHENPFQVLKNMYNQNK